MAEEGEGELCTFSVSFFRIMSTGEALERFESMIFFSTAAAPGSPEELEVDFFSDFCPGVGAQWSMWYCRMMLFFKLLLQFSQRTLKDIKLYYWWIAILTFSLLLDRSFSLI